VPKLVSVPVPVVPNQIETSFEGHPNQDLTLSNLFDKVCRGCLYFVVHDESGQTVLAALYEKDAEKYGEEDEIVKQTRCQKNLEKRRKHHPFSLNEHTTNIFSPCTYAMAILTKTPTVGEEGQN
jgi:hypothetical protein